ncbi:hypothetical protein IFM89_002846 [Coptis chinensis]|uniref:Uncharacterized protein n=1 Tax=Coptis chinensis TaxID=261450 RepID=A0A835LL06_9MAGN|nr:hypothetical protein IFM89_002846 [Coptis chinensis]
MVHYLFFLQQTNNKLNTTSTTTPPIAIPTTVPIDIPFEDGDGGDSPDNGDGRKGGGLLETGVGGGGEPAGIVGGGGEVAGGVGGGASIGGDGEAEGGVVAGGEEVALGDGAGGDGGVVGAGAGDGVGLVIERIRASAFTKGNNRITYIGDGKGDYYSCLKLKEDDHIMPIKDYPLGDLIRTNSSLIKAGVHEWSDGEELERILLHLIATVKSEDHNTNIGNFSPLTSVDFNSHAVALSAQEPFHVVIEVPH